MKKTVDWWLVFAACLLVSALGVSIYNLYQLSTIPITAPV